MVQGGWCHRTCDATEAMLVMTERDSGTTDGEMGRALVIGLGVRGGGGGGLVAKSCLTLVTPWTIALPTQARKLEWVAISFSRGCSPPRN